MPDRSELVANRLIAMVKPPVEEPHRSQWKPTLMSVKDARAYLGGISHTQFYVSIMPQLETIKIGKRRMVFIASIDQYIERQRT